jgi:MFS family permease
MHLGIHQLGYVFTCWGVLVAIFAVFVAPRAQARLGTPRTLYINLALLAVDLVVIAAFTTSKVTLIVAVIVSGAFVGLNNTLTTQAVMLVSPVDKPVASAAYGFVRFIGGGLAPYVASRLAVEFNVHVPFYLGAATVAGAIAVLNRGHSALVHAERTQSESVVPIPVPASSTSSEPGLDGYTSAAPPAGLDLTNSVSPIVAAIDTTAHVSAIFDAAMKFSTLLDCPIDVVHVVETDVIEELASVVRPTAR